MKSRNEVSITLFGIRFFAPSVLSLIVVMFIAIGFITAFVGWVFMILVGILYAEFSILAPIGFLTSCAMVFLTYVFISTMRPTANNKD
jgi:hypothetical protein